MSARTAMSNPDFETLLRKARTGDEAAWSRLYAWIAPQLLGFLRASRVLEPEDVLGDVFVEVARQVHIFKGDARGFRAWVFTIARRRRVDAIRRSVRRPEEPLSSVHGAIPSALDVESEAITSVALDEMLDILDQLTDDQREVLILRAAGGWTSREIGEITGRTTGSVEQLQRRATLALRRILEGA